MKARCNDCRKNVTQTSARFAFDATITARDLNAGTLKGQRIYGPDCFERLLESGYLIRTDDGIFVA